jgi:recombination protein RecT
MSDNLPMDTKAKRTSEPMPAPTPAQRFREFQEVLVQYKLLIQAVLKEPSEAGRFCLLAENMLRKNPKLLECNPRSFALAILQMAEFQLEPVMGHCYPVPYKQNVTMQLGYQGMIQLARNSGRIVNIWAEVVREGDDFEYTLGTDRKITHVRKSALGAKLLHAYACATYVNGGLDCVVLSADEVEARRKVSKSASFGDSPWKNWPEEMWKKTAVRALYKYLPKSVQMQLAVNLDDAATLGRPAHPMTAPAADLPFVDVEEVDEVQE